MKKYFQSMEKIINIGPDVIFPSHGIALGGVEKLKETLIKEKETIIKRLEAIIIRYK